jgi:hypothetical protein
MGAVAPKTENGIKFKEETVIRAYQCKVLGLRHFGK